MARKVLHRLSPEEKVGPVLRALEQRYGAPRRPHLDPLEVLVRGILSQNTTDVNSDRAYGKLMRTFRSWRGVDAARRSVIERAIREGGLAVQKAAAIKSVLRRLRGGGRYSLRFLEKMSPAEAERELTSIKGVGVKTARLVLLFAFGRPVFVVDTHVHRVTRRLGLIPDGCTREKAHVLLDALVPDRRKYSGHMNLIRHGREVCRARAPLCAECCARRWCAFVRHKGGERSAAPR